MDFKELLGDEYDDNLTISQLTEKLGDKMNSLVLWNSDKHIEMHKYIELEKKNKKAKEEKEALAKEIDELKKASMSEEELKQKEKQDLLDQLNALQTEKQKSEMLAMYAGLGYDSDTAKQLVEVEFYDGEDKLAKKQELLKAANENLISGFKQKVMTEDTVPTQGTNSVSKADYWKSEYQKALSSELPYTAAAVIRKAAADGVDINNIK